jgi:hypothetical protein
LVTRAIEDGFAEQFAVSEGVLADRIMRRAGDLVHEHLPSDA